MDEMIGTILIWPLNWAPQGWFFCNGQSLAVAQYQALYSLIGNTYGGNANTFNLPDLRSRIPVGTVMSQQQPPYTSLNVPLGGNGGHATTTLTSLNLPAHGHTLNAINQNADQSAPANNVMLAIPGASAGRSFTPSLGYSDQQTGTVSLSPNSIGQTGNATPFDNTQPYLGLNFIICWQGVYPTRP